MKKRVTIMGICLFVVFGGIIFFNLFKAFMIKRFFAHYQPPAVAVASAVVQEVKWQPTISAIGTFVASNGVDISAQASGNVMDIAFKSGQYVEKDTPLIVIDDAIDQAALKFNQADLSLKTLNYQRQENLYKRGATPISNVDEAKALMEQAQAKVTQVQAQIEQKHIRAPFSGRLGIRQVNMGQYITPGQTTIVSLQALDPLYLEFYVPEHLYKAVHKGQQIIFSLENYPHVQFAAQVSAINSKVDPNTHNVLVQGTLANCPAAAIKHPQKSTLIKTQKSPDSNQLIITCDTQINEANKVRHYAFVPGMFAAVDIKRRPLPHTVIVPSTAISYSLYGNSVYVIEKSKNEDKNNSAKEQLQAKRIFVHTGEQRGNYTVIKKGLQAGQMVVSAGEIKLQDGTPVVINNDVKLDNHAPEHLEQ
ncbi:MAG: efflux transporter periplasmic adaptor subunit [Legionella sp. 40-6]|nr:efflux RND transporter periplasmic adaptor subunit [Legionella sp.]OJY37761.1 MAG: efflux transporter periplasmic adaptor subunit [Legionella sp. 40-6]